MTWTRPDGRGLEDLRPITIETGVQQGVDGSALIRWGDTHVLCAASLEDRVPAHRVKTGGGWMTAEYAMLPGAGNSRIRRERGKVGGRTSEIQRLIGRSLRAAFDLGRLGPRTLWIDCDVIQADGGTRCASITGAYVAACLALGSLKRKRGDRVWLPAPLAAVSVGVVNGHVVPDLCYAEDSKADVDLNYVSTGAGIVEVQGTAEGAPYSRAQLDRMLDLGEMACAQLFKLQLDTLEAAGFGASCFPEGCFPKAGR